MANASTCAPVRVQACWTKQTSLALHLLEPLHIWHLLADQQEHKDCADQPFPGQGGRCPLLNSSFQDEGQHVLPHCCWDQPLRRLLASHPEGLAAVVVVNAVQQPLPCRVPRCAQQSAASAARQPLQAQVRHDILKACWLPRCVGGMCSPALQLFGSAPGVTLGFNAVRSWPTTRDNRKQQAHKRCPRTIEGVAGQKLLAQADACLYLATLQRHAHTWEYVPLRACQLSVQAEHTARLP